MKLLITMMVSSFLLVGCDTRTIESETSKPIQMTITNVNPPKRFYLDLKTETGEIYENVYISKRCSTYLEYCPVGTVVDTEILTTIFTNGDYDVRLNSSMIKAQCCK